MIPRHRRRAAVRVVSAIVGLALLGAAVACWQAGSWLVRPAPARVGPPPPDLAAQPLRLTSATGGVAGWWVAGRPGRGAVLLLHALRGDRRQMLGRARFLVREGFGVLLVDLPAHGESEGGEVTFGLREASAVEAALAHLARRQPAERVAVLGVSLGAAAAVLAQPRPAPAALVLESLYPTLHDAANERLRLHLGPSGPWLAPLLLVQLPLRWGVGAARLRPLDALRGLPQPLLLLGGAEDRHTPPAQVQWLFAAATAATTKELWLVPGAAHVDLHAHAPAAYEARVLAFLRRHLAGGG